ncbi:uroporphyrinogen-III C-methyltransferase [Rhodoferax saidenbachensis]|uniref:Uroporphyrin-3 C-methyltransferase n=1 Tax=Rhodoferax saidenbachensis TaxID=1484693 RepID=A0ABU1ZND2_9BURK|nr:uroporphyrinogen-III C-methyltransferase [Rhodoferax saidenbachensis]MDR7306400.1 uroporphyrin-3 C-methyltransferase [Rhodoferax saidenbachensis]
MNTESPVPLAPEVVDVTPQAGAILPAVKSSRRLLRGVAVVAVVGLVASVFLWQKLSSIQEQLARQSADAGTQATEARATARQAQELAIETAAKLAVTEARLSEVSLQRTQLEELMQSLSRSRDENLVVDIESALRLAQQQAQLTGSAEPLLAALKSAELRVARAAQPRLTPVQRAIAKDVARIKATALADTPALLVKLDELVLLADDVPVANAVAVARPAVSLQRKTEESVPTWWMRMLSVVREEIRGLVRVSRIENPEAPLLSPEQSFFVRENLKLKLLNARLGLLARQTDSARADLAAASASLVRYFDTSSRKTQAAQGVLQQLQGQMRSLELPRVDETLAALATAAAGR